MPLDAVLFDFDMTLIDTSVALLHNVNMIADAFGRPRCSREKLLEAIGFNTRDFWTFLLGDECFRQTALSSVFPPFAASA